MCVYIYIYTHTYVYIYIYIYIHAHLHTWRMGLLPVSVKIATLLLEPGPRDPAAETAIQPRICCVQSWFSNPSSYPEECLFHRHRYDACPTHASVHEAKGLCLDLGTYISSARSVCLAKRLGVVNVSDIDNITAYTTACIYQYSTYSQSLHVQSMRACSQSCQGIHGRV